MPGEVVIRTSQIELGMFRDDYEAFVQALAADGLRGRIDEPREERSLGQVAVAVGIYLAGLGTDAARGAAVDAIQRAARATIGRAKRERRTQRLRRLPIWKDVHSDEVLAWVELPDDSADEAGE